MADLKITALHKHYGAMHAVRGIDLEIPAGEFTVLVGQSGCGKSTLLRAIAGLEDISSGSIAIAGEVVNDLPPRERDIAMVFQNYALYPYMTVYDNIAFGLRARKTPKAEIETKIQAAAKMLGIHHLLERHPRQLSGGQLQRVAIGRAIVRNARLYLFDEPLSNLDAQLRDEMRSEIKRLHQELGKTMIYVTHDQIEAMTMADRIVLMRDGRIEQQGAPLDLYERPATKYVAGFLGSPAMNFIDAQLVAPPLLAANATGEPGLRCAWPTARCWPCRPAGSSAWERNAIAPSSSACARNTSAARATPMRARVSRATQRRSASFNRQARAPTPPSSSVARRRWPNCRRTTCRM